MSASTCQVNNQEPSDVFALQYCVPLDNLSPQDIFGPIINAFISVNKSNDEIDMSFNRQTNTFEVHENGKILFVAETDNGDEYKLVLKKRGLDDNLFQNMCQAIKMPGMDSQVASYFNSKVISPIRSFFFRDNGSRKEPQNRAEFEQAILIA